MILIRLKSVVCHDQTENGVLGFGGGDEPYVTVTTIVLSPPGPPPQQGPPAPQVPLGTATTLYVLPPMLEGGQAAFGIPGSEFASFWGLNGTPVPLTDPEEAIFVVSLMEHDNGDPVLGEAAVLTASGSSVAATRGEVRQVKVDRLIKAINVARRIPTGVPDLDSPIDNPKELKFTATDLKKATAGQSVRRSLDFRGEDGWYTLEFEATIARLNARSIAAISTVEGGTSLFITDADGKVRTRYYDPRVQSPQWTPPGDEPWLELSPDKAVGWPTRNVAAVSTVPGGTSLYVVDDNLRLHTLAFDPQPGKGWGPWAPMSGPQQASYAGQEIVAVSPRKGTTCLIMVQIDGSVGIRWFLAGEANWSKWKTISPAKFTENIMATCTDGEVHIFAVDERRMLRYYHEGTDDWTMLSPSAWVWYGMASVSTVPGGLSVFVIDEAGGIQYTFKDPRLERKSWQEWMPL